MTEMVGRLYGVGVGPGDPELITPKAVRVLREAEVIFAPKSRGVKKSRALSVVEHLLKGKIIVELEFPMTRSKEILRRSWVEAVGRIYAELEKGKDAAFPTIGDPLFYSTFVHVAEKMKETHPNVEIKAIPGVTSLSACSADLVVPLGIEREKIAIIPASYGVDDLRPLRKAFDVIVLLKVSRHYRAVVERLEEAGLVDKAVVLERCGEGGAKTYSVREKSGKDLDYFSTIIVRGVRK